MKQLLIGLTKFGPYSTIETLEDRYVCDGAELPFNVVGVGDVMDWDGIRPPQLKTFPTLTEFEAALDAHLDTVARSKRYNDRFTCALRAGYIGPFQAEGQAFASWMDSCNFAAYTVLSEVQTGNRLPPETVDEFINSMPTMVWPS